MNKSRGLSERTSDIVLVAITAVVLIIVAYPLYYVLIASVSDPYDVYAGKTFLFPSGFTLDGYAAVFQDPNIVSGFLNSVKYTLIGTVFSVTMLYITAYPMAQRDLPGRKFFSIFFLITMYFGGGLVPTYLVVKSTGLVGSMWSLFLPGGVAVGNMIIVRNYFQNSVPKDLIEAAQIDGCSKMGIFLRIVIPLSNPILAVMAVFSMVAYWNDWTNGLYYVTDAKLFSVQQMLNNMLKNIEYLSNNPNSQINTSNIAASVPQASVRMAIALVGILPILVIYPFVQKYFVKGIAIGAVKG